MSSSSNSPCAACKFLRRKCAQGCIFSPYFPPDNPAKFSNVHRVFGASNVAKLLNELSPVQREDAVNSLAYEAEARLHDPVYGCVRHISALQHGIQKLKLDLSVARMELSSLNGSSALAVQSNPFYAGALAIPPAQMQGSPSMYRDQHYQQQLQMQILEAEQIAEVIAGAREQEMLRSIEQQQLMAGRLMGIGNIGVELSATVSAPAVESSAQLALLSPHVVGFGSSIGLLQQQQEQGGELQEARGGHLRRDFDGGRSGVGPSS